MVDEWCRSKGLAELRACEKPSLVGDVAPDPSEESVSTLFQPVAMVLAQFGTQIPVGSKFKVLWLVKFSVKFNVYASPLILSPWVKWDRCISPLYLLAGSISLCQRTARVTPCYILAERCDFMGWEWIWNLPAANSIHHSPLEEDTVSIQVPRRKYSISKTAWSISNSIDHEIS